MKIRFDKICILLLYIISLGSARSQEILKTITSSTQKTALVEGITKAPSQIYTIEEDKKQSAYTLYDTSMKKIVEVTAKHSFSKEEIKHKSFDGSNIIYEITKGDDKGYWSLGGGYLGTKETLDGDIKTTSSYYNGVLKKNSVDVTPLFFMNEDYYVAFGRKKGDENYKKTWEEFEIFIYRKSLKTGEGSYHKIKAPEDNAFRNKSHKLAYAGKDFFILVINKNRDGGKHIYVAAYYDYEGNLLKSFDMTIKKAPGSQSFGYFTLSSGSFHQILRMDQIWQRQATNYNAYQQPTQDARAAWYYDYNEDAFYLYASAVNKKADDGVLISKYTNEGEKLWEHYEIVEDSKFTIGKSINRFMAVVATPQFTGFRVYSIKGKHYNHFYLFDKETGAILKKEYVKEKEYKKANYFNSYSGMMGIYSDSFASYMKTFEKSKQKNHFDYGYFTDRGFMLGIGSKKKSEILFLNFEY